MKFSKKMGEWLSVGPPFVSPRKGKKHDVKPPVEGEEANVELIEALAVRVYVERGVWPGWFMARHGLPEKYENLPEWLRMAIEDSKEYPDQPLVKAAAKLVKMDDWSDLYKYIEKWLKSQGYRLKDEESGVAEPDVEFVEQISCSTKIFFDVDNAFNKCFDAKYHYKVLRPVAKVMHLLGLDAKHRDSLHAVLQSYPHPKHWAYPAGHGSDAGGTAQGTNRRWSIPEDVANQIIVGCLAFAHFRTFSFMHISSENESGFQLGNDIASV